MRQILYGVTLFIVFTSCSQKESLILDEELKRLGTASQVFSILNDKVDTIKTTNGTIFIIQPNSFLGNAGQERDSIRIEVKEVFKKSDMILNGLGTVSNGNLLESYGMIYLKATSVKEELKIKEDKSIRVLIPNKTKGSDGELFYAVENDSTLNWEYAGQRKDTTETVVTSIEKSKGAEIRRQTYKITDGQRELVSDTSYFFKFRPGFDYALGSTPIEFLPPLEYYDFEIKNLGWINCDRFINITDKVELQIQLKNHFKPIGYLIFTDINSVLEIFFEDGKAKIEELPNGFTVNIVVIDKIKGDLVWTNQSLELGTENNLTLETRPIEKNKLKTELEKLDI
jgi:hypothetical protein